MIMAGMGSRTNVMGIRIAVPAAGPNPGSTPTIVPSTHPMKAKARLVGVRAVAKPSNQNCSASKDVSSDPQDSQAEGAQGERQLEPIVESVEHPAAACQREQPYDPPLPSAQDQRQVDEQEQSGDGKTKRLVQECDHRHPKHNQQDVAGSLASRNKHGARVLEVLVERGLCKQDQCHRSADQAKPAGEETRTWSQRVHQRVIYGQVEYEGGKGDECQTGYQPGPFQLMPPSLDKRSSRPARTRADTSENILFQKRTVNRRSISTMFKARQPN